MALHPKVKQLYDTLKGGGADVGTEQEFNSWFFASGNTGYQNRKQVWQTLKDGGADAGNSYEEFAGWLGLQAVKPKQQKPQYAGPAWGVEAVGKQFQKSRSLRPDDDLPPRPLDRKKAGQQLQQNQRDIERQQAKQRKQVARQQRYTEQRMKDLPGGMERVDDRAKEYLATGEASPVPIAPNPEVVRGDMVMDENGQMQQSYMTPTGDYSSRAGAEAVEYRNAHPLEDELQQAYLERERLQEELGRAGNEAYNTYVGSGAGFMPLVAQGAAMHNSPEFSMLSSAYHQNELRIKTLERERDADGFWRTLGKELFSLDTWDFGAQEFMDAGNLLRFGEGDNLTDEQQEARETMLLNTFRRQGADQQYGENDTFMQSSATITANAIPFVVQFLATGGMETITAGGAKLGSKMAAKAAAKGFTGKVSQWIIRNTGVAAGDVAAGFLMANTVGGLATGADIMGRHQGQVVQGPDGMLRFEGGKSWGRSIYEGEVANTLEYYTEMLGAHMDGMGTAIGALFSKGAGKVSKTAAGKGLQELADKVGITKLSELFSRIKGSEFRVASSHLLKSGGVNEIPSEILEEEANLILNAALVGDNQWSDLKDWDKTQRDIIGGMFLSVGFMQSPGAIGGVHQAAQYYRYKQNTDLASARASALFGADRWNALKDGLDESNNGDFMDIVHTVLIDESINDEQRGAVVEYAKNVLKMRGYNLRTLADAKDKADEGSSSDDEVANSYHQGYNAADEEQAGVKERVDVARAWLYNLGFDDSNIESLGGEMPEDWLAALSDEQREAVEEYRNAMAAYEGMLQHVQDDMEGAIAESESAVDAQTHIETGAVHHAVLKTGGEVWVVGGNVALTPEGNIDIENSDGDLIVLDPATGGKRMIHISDLASADEPVMADQLKQDAAATIQETMATDASNRIDGVLPFQPGDEYTLPFGEEQHTITIIGDAADGVNTVVSVDGGEQQLMPMQMIQEAADAQREARIAEQAAMEAAASQQQPDEQEPEATEEVTEEPAEEEQPDEDAMPMNGDEVDWFATSPERGHRFLYDEAGLSPEEADAVVANSVKDAEKELEKVSNKAPKPGNAAQLNKYRAEKEAHEQQVAAAQAAVDYWKGVQATQQQVVADLVRRQADERAAQDAASRQAAIEAEAQYQAEQEAKKAEQAERGPFTPGQNVIDKWKSAKKIDGRKDVKVLADGTVVAGHYVLHEAGATTPSHDPTTGWKPTEGFPVNENGGSVNDRDYERDRAAQEITIRMSETFDGRAYQDVPIISDEGIDYSGNGRTIAGDMAARNNTDGAYLETARQYSEKYGFTAEDMDQFQHPRVDFMLDKKLPYTPEVFAKFNAQEMKGQNLTESAVKLGKTVDDTTFNDIVGLINQFDTMSDFYADGTAPAEAISMLLRAGVITPMQHAQMFDGDSVSGQGKEMLENLLLGKAFEGNPEAIRQIRSMPSVRQQIVGALAEVANNSTLGDYSLEDVISQAVALVHKARNDKNSSVKQGDSVSDYARQLSLFPNITGGATIADLQNTMVLLLGDILNGRGQLTFKNVLIKYNYSASQTVGYTGSFFTDASPEGMLNDAIQLINNSNKNEIKQEITAAVEQRKSAARQGSEPVTAVNTGDEGGAAGSGAERDAEGQQSDLASPEVSYRLSDEVDENGRQFVLTSNGELEFGQIGEDTGLTAAPILLSEGIITNPETNDGYGLVHIEARHGDQIRNAGYHSVIEFIEEVAKNYEVIRKGKDRNGMQTYMLQLTDKHNNTLIVELSGDGTYWNINTAGIFKTSYGAKREVVYNRHTTAKQSAETAGASLTGEQSGTTPETSMNAPTTSEGKGSTENTNVQGNSEKNVEAAVADAEAEVDTEPTDGQKEAGNYKKGHVKIDGFDVTIEQPKGSVRSGVDASGKAWSQEMHNTYGYIRGTEGVDGDHIDVFLSDHLDSWNGMVYVVDQVNKDGSFDEHKVMYGFDSEQEARDAYLSNYEEGWTGLGNITSVTRDEFRKWVDSSHRKTKPFAEYKSVKVSRPIQGLEGYTEDEILADVRAFIEQQLEDAGIEGVTIKGMALHGSRMRGDARPDSDLDVVVEYEGDISEDGLFNLVNYDLNFRGPNGVIIDINPITRGKSGTLEQYMERSRRYDEEKRAAATEATEPVQSTDTGDQAYTITPTKYTTKKNKELDVWLVKFSGEIDKKQATEIAKETRGWWDREQGGFLMRSEEAARDLAERVAGNKPEQAGNGLDNYTEEELTQKLSGATSQSDAIPEQPAAGNKPAETGNKPAKTSKKSGKRSAYVEKQIDDLAPQIEGGTTTATKAEEMARLLGMRQALTEKIDGSGRVSNATNKTKQEPSQSAGTDNQATTDQAGPKRLVSDDRMAELKERLRKKLGGQLNVGVDPELLAIGAELAVGHIERGLTKFADYAKAMLEDVGDVIRPYLKSFYNAVREMPEAEEYAEAMTPYDEVRKFDIANFDKEGPKDVVATAKSIVDEQKVEQDVGEIHKQEVAAGDLKLRAATEEDIEAGKQLYHNGEPVFAVMVTHQGHQTDSFQFTKPHITSVLLTNGKYVDPGELQVAEETDAKKAKKTSKKKKKDVSSQGVGSLFDLAPAEEETNQPSKQQDNGLPRTDELRSEGLRPEGSQSESRPAAEQGEAGEGAGQERRGSDGRGGGDRTEANRPVQPGSRLTDTEAEPSPKLNQNNNHVERGKDYAPKDVDARIEANIAAIELMKKLLESGKKATPKEMSVLRKFSGWGGLGKAFNESAYGWREDGVPNRLRKLLGEEGYQQAVMSRNSAYYTPAKVIDIMWDIARALGFKGGNVLEGSAGIGNILGLMPTDMSERSRIHAVEIDSTTGNILSLLYPDAKVEIQGFEETRVQNGTVDLSITNVPFVTGLHVIDTSGDKDLSKKFRDIHDFCIAKNVRKLREGGIGIFITSSGTLDNSQKLRDWIVSEGNSDVVGAFRLNNSTFGGTAATSDIIVVRKRVNGQKSPNAIDVSTVTGVRTVEHETGEYKTVKGKQVAVTNPMTLEYNRYFVERPEMMGGEMAFGFEKGETYRETSKALYPKRGINQDERLRAFVEDIASKDWSDSRGNTAAQETATEQPVYEELGEGVKEGSMLVDGKGQLCVARYGQAVPLEVNANKVKGRTKAQCFQDYCAIKDAVNAVLDYQTEHDDDADLQPLLDKLNKVFDDFVNTYGHFHKNTALSFLKNDMDFSSIAALEDMKERNDEHGKRVRTFKKSDIFNKRVVEKETEPKPTTIKDGVITSIYKFGRVDVPYISEQLGMGADEVKATIVQEGLGFENPMSREIEVSYEYLSGNVREKLRQAIENNEDGQYDANVKALEAVIPMNIPAHLIEFTLGSSWLDPKLYSDFIKERTGVNARVALIGGTWIVDVPGYYFTEQNRAMGVESEMCGKVVYGHELIAAALQNKTVRVSKTTKFRDGGSETIVDKVASQACATKIDEIRQDFKDWAREKMQSDPDMSAQIEEVYNESFNNYVPREIPDSFVPDYFGGASHHIKLRPHQAKAAIRATTQNVMLAHEVGTGKTFTLITTAMEMRRLGTARKPMIVVQNATVGQFVASAKELYPKAKVLTLEDSDRTAEGRKAFYAKIKYNDWDMIVIPQSAFEMIPDSEERQMNFVRDKIDEKMLVLEQMEKAGVDTKSMAYKQAEREVEKLEEELNIIAGAASEKRKQRDEKREAKTRQNAAVQAREMLDRKVDDVEDFDQMGIDAILVDEAHEYKHLGFATAMQRGVKGVDPSYSKKSQGVFLKCQAVMERTGGKNVVFATGTPISNTAAEIWTFMRYLYPAETLKDYGIYYFDDFVRNFGNISQMLEFATNGRFKENNRFAGYVNLPELVRIWSGVSDTVLTDEASDLKTKIPEMEGGKAQDIYLPQTRALRSVMKYVNAELERYENMSGKEKKENSHIPLTMYGIAKAAAVDARLVLQDAEDEPNSKTNEAVRQTLKSLEDTASYRGTVAIFADNYQNKQSGFNLYEDIRKKLIDAGVPADQIVVMKSGMSVNKKLEIFDKVNAGEVRVIMGSTFTLGTGVNIQERLHTLIHVDAPNRPMDYTQRNGRILRQGNIHKEMGKPVRVLRFGVEDSLDVTAYQRLKTKGAIADSIMHGKAMMSDSMENRTMEEDEDVFGDVVAQLSGSEYALLKNQAEREVRKLEAKRKQYEADQIYIHSQKPRLAGYIRASRQAKAEAEAALKALEGVDMSAGITVGKQHFNNADEMGDFIKEYNKKITEDMDRIRKSFMSEDTVREMTMNIGGFDFVVRTVMARDTEKRGTTLSTVTRRTMSYTCEALGLTEPVPVKQGLLRNAIEDIMQNVLTGKDARERVEAAESSIARNEHELEVISEREGRPFEQADELKQARDKLKEYEQLMKAELEAKEAKYADIDASVDAASPVEADDEDVLLREEDDTDIIRELENGPTMKVYRSMILTPDGRLLPPMSEEEEKGKQRDGESLGTWYRSDERPDLARNGKFPLRQSDKRGNPMWVAYAPYFHSAETMLNDQFKRAQSRGNLVVVECEIPVSELSSGYRAEGSKKSVGLIKNWKAGDLQTQTSGTRNVYLSRWIKPVRVVPVEEVAQHIYELIDGTGVIMPTNIVTPQLRAELEKLGVPFIETTNQGIVAEGEHKGEYYTKAYPMPHPEKFGFKRDLQLRDALVEGGRLAIINQGGKWRIEGMPGEFGSRYAAIDEWRERAAGNVVWYMSEDGNHIEVEGNGDMYEMMSLDTTTSGRKQRERMARQQATRSASGRRMVDELADKLGVKVRYVDDMTEEERAQFSDRQLRGKGWYNPRTGEVFINLGRHTRLYDILSTFLHETVAHKGLRRLFGKDFNAFVDNVYNNVNKGIRAEIDRMAEQQKSRASEAQRARHDDEHWRRVATEEYMAKLAERLDLNHPEQRTLWEKIRGWLIDHLRKVGVMVADSLSDNDLRGILWESYHNMQMEGVVGYAKGKAFRDQMEREAVNAGRAAAHETTPIAAEGVARYTGSLFDVLPQAGAWARMMSNMSERELFSEMAQDGPNVTSGYTEEYDRRHIREYNQACDEIQAQLERELPGYDRLLELLQDAEAQWADGAYKDSRRTGVLAAIDTISRALDEERADLPRVEEERADLPRVEEDNLYRDDEDDTDDVDVAGFDAGRQTFEESITAGMLKAAADNRAAIAARTAAMRALGGNLSKLRQAMARQREYDRGTVDSIVRLARSVMESGFFRGFSPYEVKRLMSLINHAAGREDITKQAGKVVDLLLKHQLLSCENMLHEQMRTRGSKLNSQGVEVQAGLDIEGQRMVSAMKHAINLDADALQQRIWDTMDRMGSEDQALADVAAAEYQGLLLAQQYVEDIKGSKQEENELRHELQNAKDDLQAGAITREQYNQLVAETENAIRENRLERVAAYDQLTTALGAGLGASVQRAKEWREMQKERVNEIRHNANSDLEGVPADEHVKPSWMQQAANWSIVRFFIKPLANFDYMLRMLGRKNVNGEGYLWQRFMGGWTDAADREWRNLKAAHKVLDEKVSEVFGKDMRWSDLFALERKLPGMDVSFWDAGEEKVHTLSQGNMLYIYMVNKMGDGRMKLRKMGITEEDVETIRQRLDPRFIQLADWLQEDFLVNKRNDYNAVYQRMFGASMAAIEHYFPLKINSRSRGQEEDLNNESYLDDNNIGSTITGSIIKRKRNSLPLDVTGADAFDVVLGHLQDMEHWAAFAEFNRDLNTLLSYKRFRNRLLNMSSIRFGSGKTLWMNFKRTCAIASGAYRPKMDRDSVDTTLVNVAKGVTAAKISFRLFTAMKQLLSYPAYLSEASGLELIKSSNPVGAAKAWNWALNELPGFAQRWQSRQAGDSRLRESDADWGLWRNKIVETASRLGMSPNAFIDGLTVAMGAKAIYETKLKRYRKAGYTDELAKKKALRDASISYNETQQSNANAYLSAMQLDRSAASVALTVFRNASMGYQRRLFQSIANLKHIFTPGYKEQALEFMSKQMVRDGLNEQDAARTAARIYRRAKYKNLADFAIFGWVMQMAWNLGPYLPYLLMGDDDDDKKEMLEDAALHAIAGGIEGLSAGNVMSDIYNMSRSGQDISNYNFNLLPLMSDIQNMMRNFKRDGIEGANDLVNLIVQAGVGVNPQTLTDWIAAGLDFADGNPELSHEFGLLVLRVMSVPQNQLDKLYIDELGMTASDAQKLNAGQMAERYTRYKKRRGSMFTGWAYGAAGEEKADEHYMKKFETKAKERVVELDDAQLEDNFNTDDTLRRKWIGQEVAKRAGGVDSYGSPDTDYGVIYERKRNYTDLAQDILIQVEKKKAKDAGDKERYKALDSAQKELTTIKKGKHTKTIDEPGLGEGFDDEVMTRLRERRKELLSELGIM